MIRYWILGSCLLIPFAPDATVSVWACCFLWAVMKEIHL
jgi:hypothetical protein